MNKELCFILENKNVYLDHILVDYEYVPIFFLCKDDECQYYLALCTDIENGEYIVVKISLLSVYNLLHGNIAMRDVILNQKIFWKVVSGDEIKNDIVNEYPIDYKMCIRDRPSDQCILYHSKGGRKGICHKLG